MLSLDIAEGSHRHVIQAPYVFPDENAITIFTDGACGKNGIGGWACALQWRDKVMVRFGCAAETTSNAMELTAINVALAELKKTRHRVVLYTDSQYSKNTLTVWGKTWKRNSWITAQGTPVKNVELVKELLCRYETLKGVRPISIEWIRGHQSLSTDPRHRYNCMVDDLATKAKKRFVSNHPL